MELNPLTAQVDIGGIWRMAIFFGCFILLVNWFRPHKNVTSAFACYVLSYALYTISFPALGYGEYHTAFQATAGQVFAELICVVAGMVMITQPKREKILSAFRWVILAELICIWFKLPGLMMEIPFAGSFDVALAALYFPFAPRWLKVLTLGTVIMNHSTTALLIMLAQTFALCIKDRASMLRLVAGSAVVLIAVLMLQHDHHGQKISLLAGTSRFERWQTYMSFWSSNWFFWLFGTGPGSFMWLAMSMDRFKHPMFLWMHSDWLQILFELGAVGFVLAVGVLVRAIRYFWHNPKLLSAVFGSAAFCLTYHPLRYFPTAFLMALIFSYKSR